MKKYLIIEDFDDYCVNTLCENEEELFNKSKEILETGHCKPEYISVLEVCHQKKLIDLFNIIEEQEPA